LILLRMLLYYPIEHAGVSVFFNGIQIQMSACAAPK
jgi:hypothetical protein